VERKKEQRMVMIHSPTCQCIRISSIFLVVTFFAHGSKIAKLHKAILRFASLSKHILIPKRQTWTLLSELMLHQIKR
jgi:hypothetical protein